ncbi:DUF6114 domain-containing protein [Streptomyces sp. NPDC048717]|uniref:DUF6114 domain-containing protein n=1 Tax=Streptomyces sp. NPDC048717 TaxID=3154928 RepID=UPI00342319B9
MSAAETTISSGVRKESRFRVWRQTRPFWAGLFTMLGGVPIGYLPYGDVRLGNITLAMATTAGAGALIIGVLLVTLGLTMWFQPIVRVFAGIASIVLGLISLPVSNFGGLGVGFLFALVGGGMSVAWAPADPVAEAETEGGGGSEVEVEGGSEAGSAVAEAAPGEHMHDGTAGTARLQAPQQDEQSERGEQGARDTKEPAAETTTEATGGRNHSAG